jgi:23S rRNA-/tRNA-specific pseudouridylate synthase
MSVRRRFLWCAASACISPRNLAKNSVLQRAQHVLAIRKPPNIDQSSVKFTFVRHTLDDFTEEYVRDRILFKNDHFLLINKPFDVRMFGDFDLTVSKLLAKVYPGMEFKAVHQLDYATSGVLWCVTTWSACLLKSRHYYTI